MKDFWVDFSGYLKIKAESKQEAEGKFWDWVNLISGNGDCSDDSWKIDDIEPVEGETDF